MKRFLIFCFLIFAGSIFFVANLDAQTLRIGVFDMQRIMRDSKVIQEYRGTLGKEIEAKRKLLAEKQDSVRLIEERSKREDQGLSLDERKRLEERLARELKELQRLKEDIDMELRKIDRELSQRAIREINEIIREIAKKEKYSIVFEKAMAGIAYHEEPFDITQKIINLYDSKK